MKTLLNVNLIDVQKLEYISNNEIKTTSLPFEINIKDNLGRVIYKRIIQNSSNQITIKLDGSIESGAYYFTIQNFNFNFVKEIIKL